MEHQSSLAWTPHATSSPSDSPAMLSSTRNAPSQLGKASLSIPRAEHAKLWTLMIQQGNSIGKTRPPLLASAANIEVDPVTVTGTIGPERRMGFADASDRT